MRNCLKAAFALFPPANPKAGLLENFWNIITSEPHEKLRVYSHAQMDVIIEGLTMIYNILTVFHLVLLAYSIISSISTLFYEKEKFEDATMKASPINISKPEVYETYKNNFARALEITKLNMLGQLSFNNSRQERGSIPRFPNIIKVKRVVKQIKIGQKKFGTIPIEQFYYKRNCFSPLLQTIPEEFSEVEDAAPIEKLEKCTLPPSEDSKSKHHNLLKSIIRSAKSNRFLSERNNIPPKVRFKKSIEQIKNYESEALQKSGTFYKWIPRPRLEVLNNNKNI